MSLVEEAVVAELAHGAAGHLLAATPARTVSAVSRLRLLPPIPTCAVVAEGRSRLDFAARTVCLKGISDDHPRIRTIRSVGRIPAPASAAMNCFACPVCRTVYEAELSRVGRQTMCEQCDAISAISAQPNREVNSEETELSAGDLRRPSSR